MQKLSICICHLTSRKKTFDRLMECLEPQLNSDIEMLVESDNGELNIGEKRNRLLDRFKGLYVAFIDDDDLVADDYCQSILEAIKPNPDYVSIHGLWLTDQAPRHIHWSKNYKGFTRDGNQYKIGANHICPVRRDIATKARFKNINMGEDQDYGMQIRDFLNTETEISHPIYWYFCSPANSASKAAVRKKGF